MARTRHVPCSSAVCSQQSESNSCGDPKYCSKAGNGYACENNDTPDFWQCGGWDCDPGYHAVGYDGDQSCATGAYQTRTRTHCQENAGNFWMCSKPTCPSGWHVAGKQCNAASACGTCSTAGGWNSPINEIYCVKNYAEADPRADPEPDPAPRG
jgi:hypothetical protein